MRAQKGKDLVVPTITSEDPTTTRRVFVCVYYLIRFLYPLCIMLIMVFGYLLCGRETGGGSCGMGGWMGKEWGHTGPPTCALFTLHSRGACGAVLGLIYPSILYLYISILSIYCTMPSLVFSCSFGRPSAGFCRMWGVGWMVKPAWAGECRCARRHQGGTLAHAP